MNTPELNSHKNVHAAKAAGHFRDRPKNLLGRVLLNGEKTELSFVKTRLAG
jgi:hypothetical protein